MSIEVQQFLNDSGGNFTETAPRPPVPGEENELQSNGGTSTRSSGSLKSHLSSKSHSSGKSHRSENSPVATPRRSNLDKNSIANSCSNKKLGSEDIDAPLGFEPEGSAASSPPFTENSTPQYLKWAENLTLLLEDSEGVKLFKQFLDQEQCSNTLDFWFACGGLKIQDEDKIHPIVKLIYKKYIKNDQLSLRSETKRRIIEKIARKEHSQTIFDEARREIEDFFQSETYPLFLKSDLYVQYIQTGGDSPKTSNTSSGSNSVRPLSGPLPTLPEGDVLKNEDIRSEIDMNKSQPLPLTLDALKLTQMSRATTSLNRRTEASCLQQSAYPLDRKRHGYMNPYHISYAPVSAQDSELQSLSSDAHTDDTMSLTDSSVDGRDVGSYHGSKKWRRERRQIKQNLKVNTHTQLTQNIIPRTERAPKDRNVAETDPQKFASMLIEKLLKVLEKRDNIDRINESFKSIELNERKELDDSAMMPPPLPPHAHNKSVINNSLNDSTMNASMNTSSINNSLHIANMMASMNPEEEESAQSILEEHLARVWEQSNEQTPSRSPPGGRHSPKSWSPERSGSYAGRRLPPPTPNTSGLNLSLGSRGHHKRKDVDDFAKQQFLSAVSFDSGMGEDRLDKLKHVFHHHHHHHHSKDSRSSLDAQKDSHQKQRPVIYSRDPTLQVRGHSEPLPGDTGDSRGRPRDSKRSSAKKNIDSSSNIDSGVSIPPYAYDIASRPVPNGGGDQSNEKVLQWMNQNDRMSNSSNAQYSTDGSDKASSSHKRSAHNKSVSSTASPAPHRSSRKLVGYGSSRSGSTDRSSHHLSMSADYSSHLHHSGLTYVQPSQPIMQDPSMPLLNPPNPTTQLEEAKRLLEDESKRLVKSRSFTGSSSSKDRNRSMMMGPPTNYPPLPPRSLPLSKSIPSATAPLDLSSSEESSKSESRKTMSSSRKVSSSAPATPAQEMTVVGYYFCDEPIPYRTQLPGKQITLAMFKNLITKKGSYRYFFKMASDEFDSGVIMEEVADDNAVVPQFEGKVVGKVKKIE